MRKLLSFFLGQFAFEHSSLIHVHVYMFTLDQFSLTDLPLRTITVEVQIDIVFQFI